MKERAPWLAAAIILFIIFGTIYVVVQQSQRSDANYPQIQIAEVDSAALNAGSQPSALVSGRVNINASLAPFVVIYNKSGRAISGSGYLNGALPAVPFGVLSSANNKSYSQVTWQPQGSLKVAAVTVSANNYYVLSGRSLKEVAINEDKTFILSVLGGFVSLVVLCSAYVISDKRG